MKKITLLTILLGLGSLSLQAQTDTIYIKGKVTDSLGAVANHTVSILIDAMNDPFTYNGTVLTDANGEYTEKIAVPSPSEGLVRASILNCKGETRLENHAYWVDHTTWTDSNHFQINFNSCPGYKDGGCYGSFSQKVIGDRTVEFKVHLPDCKDIKMMLYFGDGMAQGIEGPAWSSYGETTIVHKYQSKDYYNACLDIETDNGCTIYHCDTVEVGMEPGKYLIDGELVIDTSAYVGNLSADIYLIVYDAVQGTLTAIDTVTNYMNSIWGPPHRYSFGYVPAGKYLVKAALRPSPWYQHNLPTYYGDKLYWYEATEIDLTGDRNDLDIHFIKGNNPGGPGFIGGYVSQGANRTAGSGDPLAGISILVTNSADQAVAHMCTYANGDFSFNSLPLGTYKVTVEIPGKPCETYQVTLTSSQPSNANQAMFEVNSNSISLVTTGIGGASTSIRELYPNPASSELYMQLDIPATQSLMIEVCDLLGNTIIMQNHHTEKGLQPFSLNIGHLDAGMYLLRVSTGKTRLTSKFIKEN